MNETVSVSKHLLNNFWTTGFGGSPLMGGIASAAGSLLDNIFAGSRIKKQLKANKELAQYQFDLNRQQWQAENEYNSPKAQMQRLKEAGLNPNLVYGNGSVSGNTTTAGPRYEAPKAERNMERMSGLLSFFSAYQDLRQKKANADNAEMLARLNAQKSTWQDYFNRREQSFESYYLDKLNNEVNIGDHDVNTAFYRSELAREGYDYQLDALKLARDYQKWLIENAKEDKRLKEQTYVEKSIRNQIYQMDLNNYMLDKMFRYVIGTIGAVK